MTITRTMKDGILTLAPEGRIDIATAPELEQAINSSRQGVSELILDFEKIIYISSAGLRVLLRTHKNMGKEGGAMKVIHVSENVMSVFDDMGFSNILTIE